MFHSLGAPDLYRYNEGSNVSPVGNWDLMATNSKPPQNMSAYMKYKYGNWIDSIPLITTPGTYTLHSVADSVPGNNIYRFPSSDPDQFYIVEYRDNTELFDKTLAGKGLLVYRIDTRFNGNAGYDGVENFDEVWLFRPGSADGSTNGIIGHAFFSSLANRTEFSPSTDPFPYLSDGTRDYTFSIYNISIPGNTITFRYTNRTKPANLTSTNVTTATATLNWNGNSDTYRLRYRQRGTDDPYTYRLVHTNHVTITGLFAGASYNVKVQAMCSATTYSDWSETVSFSTPVCQSVTDVQVSGVTSHSAVVSWTPVGEESEWIVSYGYYGFDQGTGTEVTVSTTTYTITGLESEMEYDVYVRAACTDDIYSDWVGNRFTTLGQTGITPVDGTFACNIYPNPTSNAAIISVDGVRGQLLVSVVDMSGRVLFSDELWCDGTADCRKQLSVEGLAQGAYYVHIVADSCRDGVRCFE